MDPKGRLFIPAKLREADQGKGLFILTRGLERCLYLYSKETFQDVLVSKLGSMPVKNKQDGRAFKRMFLAGAQEAECDDMGRVLVPKSLGLYAGLKKDVSILGVGERIELWDSAKWESYSRQAATTFQKLGRHLEI